MGELTPRAGESAGPLLAVIGEPLVAARVFEDGTAVFDPVTWQTHILSHEGAALLGDMVRTARLCGGDPERLCSRLLAQWADPGAAAAPGHHLRQWATLACHLAADLAAPRDP